MSRSESAAFPAPAATTAARSTHFVSFRIDRQLYALPLKHVERAVRMVAAAPVPEAPPWIAGVMNLHGQVIPVVDLRQRFGQPSREPDLDDRLLIMQAQGQTAALMVDEVIEVFEPPVRQVEPAPAALSQSRPVTAVIRRDEDLILVLDAAQLLPPEEIGGQSDGPP